MTKCIDNTEDVIDSRDVISRIEELQGEREAITDQADLDDWDGDNGDELDALKALAEEASGSPDWNHGETLIRDSYFKTYAQELAEDCCEVPKDLAWPYTCIDWDQACRELQMDYTSVDFDGVDYWIRS
jgi:hypothetical protein